MTNILTPHALLGAVLFSSMGLVIFGVGFWIFDKITPYALWKEIIEEKNTALALVVGSVAIGTSMIIAAAIQ